MALKKPAVVVVAGTVEAVTAQIRVLIERLRVVNRRLKDAHRQLDRLCGLLAEPMENELGQMNEQRDAAILASLPGNGRMSSSRCSQRVGNPCNGETTTPCGACAGLLPSPGARARAVS